MWWKSFANLQCIESCFIGGFQLEKNILVTSYNRQVSFVNFLPAQLLFRSLETQRADVLFIHKSSYKVNKTDASYILISFEVTKTLAHRSINIIYSTVYSLVFASTNHPLLGSSWIDFLYHFTAFTRILYENMMENFHHIQ